MRALALCIIGLGSSFLVACGGGKHSAERARAVAHNLNAATASNPAPTHTLPTGPELEAKIARARDALYLSGYRSFDGWSIPGFVGEIYGYDAAAIKSIKAQLLHIEDLGHQLFERATVGQDSEMAGRAKRLLRKTHRNQAKVDAYERSTFGRG